MCVVIALDLIESADFLSYHDNAILEVCGMKTEMVPNEWMNLV